MGGGGEGEKGPRLRLHHPQGDELRWRLSLAGAAQRGAAGEHAQRAAHLRAIPLLAACPAGGPQSHPAGPAAKASWPGAHRNGRQRRGRPLTFSPLSLPTTRISRPTSAACGASGTSAGCMYCSREGSNRMKPKSCTARRGAGTDAGLWSRQGAGQAGRASRPCSPRARGRRCALQGNRRCCEAGSCAGGTSFRRMRRAWLARMRSEGEAALRGWPTWVVVERLHRHLLAVQKDSLRHHWPCRGEAPYRRASRYVPAHGCTSGGARPGCGSPSKQDCIDGVQRRACQAGRPAQRSHATSPGVTTCRLVRISPRARSTTKPVA